MYPRAQQPDEANIPHRRHDDYLCFADRAASLKGISSGGIKDITALCADFQRLYVAADVVARSSSNSKAPIQHQAITKQLEWQAFSRKGQASSLPPL